MSSQRNKADILQVLNDWYSDSFILKQAAEVRGVPPVVALGRYVASVVEDLYSERSDDAGNVDRIAHALEVGSATLARIAKRLREA